jgi:hypothetical protein
VKKPPSMFPVLGIGKLLIQLRGMIPQHLELGVDSSVSRVFHMFITLYSPNIILT